MSKIKQLVESYARYIMLPWQRDAAPAQRVIFCIYPEHYELTVRARVGEFALATELAGHSWRSFDLTNTFATWMAGQKYAARYFTAPSLLDALLPTFLPYLTARFDAFLDAHPVTAGDVVALTGVGSLFGFVRVKAVVDAFAPRVPGRLVVLFPGSYEGNNYRLLDGYDGWNYHAVSITPGKEF